MIRVGYREEVHLSSDVINKTWRDDRTKKSTEIHSESKSSG